MTDLTEKADKWIATCAIDRPSLHEAYNLIIDCRAEIQRLSQVNESLRGQNESLDAECARLEAMLAAAPKGELE